MDKIEFLGRGDYERVIIHLDRVGSSRNVRTTQVVVERMPVSALSQAVPNAPKPRRGQTAIVVNLEGVRQAPNLRGYRPSATNIVKEFSLVRDGRSRSAVISTSRGTCYQVRVPVFGSSASGKERNAEVFIDLR